MELIAKFKDKMRTSKKVRTAVIVGGVVVGTAVVCGAVYLLAKNSKSLVCLDHSIDLGLGEEYCEIGADVMIVGPIKIEDLGNLGKALIENAYEFVFEGQEYGVILEPKV